ncbi:MAG: P-II family nitrogen regulator [Rhodobacterales bacterium]|nr:P-II family nitrogen regulator [Rhodobacterales bacterium]
MNMKLIMALVDDHLTERVIEAARKAGATGSTVITSARGEGLTPQKTFLGLDLTVARDVLLFLVAAPRAREILETIASEGGFDDAAGSGIAFVLGIDDAVGMSTQLPTIKHEIEEEV